MTTPRPSSSAVPAKLRGVVTFAGVDDDRKNVSGVGTTTTPRLRHDPHHQCHPHPHETTADRRLWHAGATPGGLRTGRTHMRTPLSAAPASAAVTSRQRKHRMMKIMSTPASEHSTASKLWNEQEKEDEDELQNLWVEPWVVAQSVQDHLRRVQDNLLLRRDINDSHSRESSLGQYVELLRTLQSMQAVHVERLLEHVTDDNKKNSEAAAVTASSTNSYEPKESPSFRPNVTSRNDTVLFDRRGRGQGDANQDEKKEDMEEDAAAGRHDETPVFGGELAPSKAESVDADSSYPARWSLLAEWQVQQEARFGFLRLGTLEEVEYESDRTTPGAAAGTAVAATPSAALAASVHTTPSFTGGDNVMDPNRDTPGSAASAARNSVNVASAGRASPWSGRRGSLSTPGRALQQRPPSSSGRKVSSSASYVDAPSDEMDSRLWEHESNRTLNTYDDDSEDTFQRLYGTSGSTSQEDPRTTRRMAAEAAASSRTPGNQADLVDDDEDDEYDSALDCPTILASHRESRTVRSPRSPPRGNDEPRQESLAAHATPSSAFRNKVVVVDYSENQPSPTMTNITMDEDAFDAVVEVKEEGHDGLNDSIEVEMDVNEQVVVHVHNSLPSSDFVGRKPHGLEDDDNATTTSQETPVLERYRIDLDEESPHGFTVIPNPRRSRRGTRSGGTPIDARARSSARSPSQHSPATTLLEKASMAFNAEELGLSMNTTSSCNTIHTAERQWLASPEVSQSGRHRSARKALRKSPYKLPKLVPTTPTIDENAPLTFPGDVGVSSSVERHQRRTESSARLEGDSRRRASIGCLSTRLSDAWKEPLVQFKSATSTPGSSASTLLYANAQLVLRDAKQMSRSHHSFDYNDLRCADASPGEGRGYLVPAAIPALTEEEYNSSRCIARSGITLDEAQRAIAALNQVLWERSDMPSPGLGSGDRSVLRSSPYLQTRGEGTPAPTPRSNFREHEAKRILMKSLNIGDRKSKTILVGLCHWRRLVLRRQSFGDGSSFGGAVGSTEGREGGNDDDNASTSSSTTLSLLLYDVPTAKPRETMSLV